MLIEILTSRHHVLKKEHQKWLKIGPVEANQSFQVERYLFSDDFAHKITSVRQILTILASK